MEIIKRSTIAGMTVLMSKGLTKSCVHLRVNLCEMRADLSEIYLVAETPQIFSPFHLRLRSYVRISALRSHLARTDIR